MTGPAPEPSSIASRRALARRFQTPSTTRAAPFVLAALLTVACASLPHPPTGAMWGYLWTPAAAPSLEIVGYTADRPSCEYTRLRSETRGGVPVPSQLSAPCQQLDVLPYRDGAAPVYWVFSVFVGEAGTDRFAAGGNDPAVCANLRREALKALPPGSKLRECEPVVVKRVM